MLNLKTAAAMTHVHCACGAPSAAAVIDFVSTISSLVS
jgi:hypothetical protein